MVKEIFMLIRVCGNGYYRYLSFLKNSKLQSMIEFINVKIVESIRKFVRLN